jgi:hypothetical protein
VALTLTILIAGGILLGTDLRGRAEVRTTQTQLTMAEGHEKQGRLHLLSTQTQVGTASADVRSLQASITRTQASLDSTNAAIASTEQGLFFGGFNISALTNCLAGVTQALDQIAVGQTAGALSSLGAASPSCTAAKPAAG